MFPQIPLHLNIWNTNTYLKLMIVTDR